MNNKSKDALAEYRRKIESGEMEAPVKEFLSPIEKAKKKPTPVNCIKAKCFECMGAGGEPNVRILIRECNSVSCPLHPVRPHQSKTIETEEN